MLVADTHGLVGRDSHKRGNAILKCRKKKKPAELCEKCARMLAFMATIGGRGIEIEKLCVQRRGVATLLLQECALSI